MARKSNVEIVMSVDRQREATRAASLRSMNEQASSRARQVAGTLTAGARRNAFGGIFPFIIAQAQRQRRGRR